MLGWQVLHRHIVLLFFLCFVLSLLNSLWQFTVHHHSLYRSDQSRQRFIVLQRDTIRAITDLWFGHEFARSYLLAECAWRRLQLRLTVSFLALNFGVLLNDLFEVSLGIFPCFFRLRLCLHSCRSLKINSLRRGLNFLITKLDSVVILRSISTLYRSLRLLWWWYFTVSYFHKVSHKCINLIFVFRQHRCRNGLCTCFQAKIRVWNHSMHIVSVNPSLCFVFLIHLFFCLELAWLRRALGIHPLLLLLLHFGGGIICGHFLF